MPRRLRIRSSFRTAEETLKQLETDVAELRKIHGDLEAVVEDLIERIQSVEEKMEKLEDELYVLRRWLQERGYKLP